MTPQPQQQYIITEKQVQEIVNYFSMPEHAMDDADYEMQGDLIKAIRSRPAHSPKGCPACQNTDCDYCDLMERPLPDLEKALAEAAAKAREDVLEQLSDLNRYACQEYDEASCSDNEREMRIHLEYGNRTWGIIRSLRTGGDKA